MNIYSPKNVGVRGNIWKFGILYVTNKRPYMTFLTIFLLLMPNTTAQTIGVLTALGQIAGLIFEVPSGYISDKIGHKTAIVIARIAYLLSTLCYIFATSKIYFFVGAIFFAIGIAMLSGTTSTFLKESLDHIGLGERYSSISGKLKSFGFAIPILLILLVSFIAETDFQMAFIIVGIVDIIGLIIAFSLTSVPQEKTIQEFDMVNTSNIIKDYLKIGWVPYVIAFELVLGITFGATMGFKNPFQESIGFSIGIIGILWAFSRVLISLLLLGNGWLKKNLNFKKLFILQSSLFIISLMLIGLSANKWIIATGFIISTTTMFGLESVKNHFYLEYISLSKNKVSMLSINSFIQNIFVGFVGIIMGWLVITYGYSRSYLYFGIILIIVFFVSYFVLKYKNHNKK